MVSLLLLFFGNVVNVTFCQVIEAKESQIQSLTIETCELRCKAEELKNTESEKALFTHRLNTLQEER